MAEGKDKEASAMAMATAEGERVTKDVRGSVLHVLEKEAHRWGDAAPAVERRSQKGGGQRRRSSASWTRARGEVWLGCVSHPQLQVLLDEIHP
ncbi:hypothetical protein E2562_017503 [Oryza meyeriana var. granulata]|uniref:Uncharacterized protein n=1 Tax=Oryza meyeriana var. granulata TaxID=110450 RepID=A0A6G1DXV0_9ORYZ|nr:hypothetical protein E2562_017503 [Oryza meyeriana var. granulata]